MTEVALVDAENRLSELFDRLQSGEVFTITRCGMPVARLSLPETDDTALSAHDAIARLRASRRGVSLGGTSSTELIAEGRS